jgi:hypothetical protein
MEQVTTTFESLIEDIKFLIQQEKEENQQRQKNLESSLFLFIEEIRLIYQAEKQRLLNEISVFRQNYSFLKNESVLQCIGELHKEKHHSKFLAYIWKHNKKIFSDFISLIPQISNDEKLRVWILEGDYFVVCEKRTIDSKFIDLLIKDNQNRFCIVIENKIDSVVSRYENDKLQLYYYYKHINKKTPKDAVKYYLLLSHRNNKKYTIKNEWIYTSYYPVFRSMIQNYSTEDDILKQYIIALFSLLFNSKEMGNTIDKNTPISKMSLFYQNIITQIK